MTILTHRTAYRRKVEARRREITSGGVDGHAATLASPPDSGIGPVSSAASIGELPRAGIKPGPLTLCARIGIGGTFAIGLACVVLMVRWVA